MNYDSDENKENIEFEAEINEDSDYECEEQREQSKAVLMNVGLYLRL